MSATYPAPDDPDKPGFYEIRIKGELRQPVLAALGVGLWLSALNVQYRDVRYTIPFLTQFWMYATPIVYPSSLLRGKWRTLFALNPMVGVVGRGSSSRDVTYPVVGVVARGSSLHDASYPVVNVVAGTRRNMTIA